MEVTQQAPKKLLVKITFAQDANWLLEKFKFSAKETFLVVFLPEKRKKPFYFSSFLLVKKVLGAFFCLKKST
jgi:hypothetical protein